MEAEEFITFLIERSVEIKQLYLLSIYEKSDISSISDKEIKELIREIKPGNST